ncbi:ferredoxin--NADP reductase [Pseudoroseomonas globiformis]|uniref:ferredoxin--NADP(+) reductase n=1 Tax=Teichococcus globiformis TaxID=2307229 RepID=A0ABV7G2B0_9PROT
MNANTRPALKAAHPAYFTETVQSVHHWTDRLFSFRCTRNTGLRFTAGQFVMIGLMNEGKPLVRAYSVASPPYDEGLEFLSIKVQDGPLTSRLQHIRAGDEILVGKKSVGTLVTDALLPGKTLWLYGTGTGLAPFLSLIREPDVYDRYERVVLLHGVREVKELAYADMIEGLAQDEVLGELIGGKLAYYPTVTREPFRNQGRVTDLIRSGKLFGDLGLPAFSPESDRIMLCGSPEMLAETKGILESMGFEEGANSRPGHYVIEKAFVEK